MVKSILMPPILKLSKQNLNFNKHGLHKLKQTSILDFGQLKLLLLCQAVAERRTTGRTRWSVCVPPR